MTNIPPPLPLYTTGDWRGEEQKQLSEPVPPRTGTTLPFIWPPPHHIQTPPDFEEPVVPFPPAESLMVREMELDALRCEEPENHKGTQVYDSLQPPPHDDYTPVHGATDAEAMPRWYIPKGREDDTLLFESRFESGNLSSAEKIGDDEYNLQLAFDINTDRHTQWFYFRVSNLRLGRLYKLNMQNLMKTDAVYNLGMQPLMYSQMRAEREGVGWHRTGSGICYFKNQLTRAKTKPFYTLTFSFQTDYEDDTVYLAHCFPYRYTDLEQYLSEMENSALGKANAIRRRTLCQTLAGNDCDMLTITSPSGPADHGATDQGSKKGIVISARVHPGETNASWMMKGVLDFLQSDSRQARALRDKFVFKIVPMLNPDGVIVGNYRCSLAGGDLNRQYEDPKRELFPEVVNLKQMIANFGMGKEVILYVDLHGHSKKSNIFMYGVENPTDESLYMTERVIPTLLDRTSALFSLKDCSFDVGKGKEGCGRVVVRKHLGIVRAYTMEASFMGADQGIYKGLHFNQGHFESMGRSLCEILLDLVDPDQGIVDDILCALKEKFPIDHSRVVAPRDDDKDMDSGGTSEDSDGAASRAVRPSSKHSSTKNNNNKNSNSSSNINSQRKIGGSGVSRPTSTRGKKMKSPRASDSSTSSDSDGVLSRDLSRSGNSFRVEKDASATATAATRLGEKSATATATNTVPGRSTDCAPAPSKLPPPGRPRPPSLVPPAGAAAATTAATANCQKPPPAKSLSAKSSPSSRSAKAKGALTSPNSGGTKNRPSAPNGDTAVSAKDLQSTGGVLKGARKQVAVSRETAAAAAAATADHTKANGKVSSKTKTSIATFGAKTGTKLDSVKSAAKGNGKGTAKEASVSRERGELPTASSGGTPRSRLAPAASTPRSAGGQTSAKATAGGSTSKKIKRTSKSTPKTASKGAPKDLPKAATVRTAERPASCPASRSLKSPRRQAAVAATAAKRSPSAPPAAAAGAKRRGVGGAVACSTSSARSGAGAGGSGAHMSAVGQSSKLGGSRGAGAAGKRIRDKRSGEKTPKDEGSSTSRSKKFSGK